MAVKELKWSQMRREYERGDTFAVLAERYGTSTSSLSRRARLEGWGRRGCACSEPGARGMDAVTQQLWEAAQQTLSGECGTMSVKEMTEMAGLVRELMALRTAAAAAEQGACGTPAVRVVLEGEAEKWSV